MYQGAIKFFQDGGPIMYPLLLCSLVGLTVVIERSLFHLRRKFSSDRGGLLKVLDLIRSKKMEEARARIDRSSDDMLAAIGRSLGREGAEKRGVFEMIYAEEDRRMSRSLGVLDTIITLSPLLGILGTVLGIIESFDLLGEMGARDPMAVTGGIAKALITTATGLAIAILMLIPYNFFRARTESTLNEIEEVGTFLETYTGKTSPGESGD